jgi:hypothetical protein
MKFTKEQSQEFEIFLQERGYTKYIQSYKSEDYLYWKSFERIERGKGGYSVGFAFYDFSKYPQFEGKEKISISLEFMIGVNPYIDRLDLTISDDRLSVEQFEDFCKKFYEFYNLNKP